ncbi:VOC family protein [Opacimonas viscosa]|uniref:VOC family protein n=1 Tax=Opacimonas viscosa TaxID=2961944 RepID=A0AA41WYG4_9ALTE|nr:VOC family protein [Opacimonas viscosa]MCP3428854.1 VOC family protein [Opacimonas viscosa]
MNVVGWFEIYCSDLERAGKFYSTVLDVQLTDNQMEDFSMKMFPEDMQSYGSAGALAYEANMAPGANSTVVYFNCEDCAVEASRIVAAGGSVLREKMSIGEHGFIVMGQDTEGNMFGLHSMQ